MQVQPEINEIYCYEYLDGNGDVEIVILDPAGAPIQKNKIIASHASYKKPGISEINVTKMITNNQMSASRQQSAFEYCLSFAVEGVAHEVLGKFTDDEWYKLFSDVEREIPPIGRPITYH